jgi:hypothetical protein
MTGTIHCPDCNRQRAIILFSQGDRCADCERLRTGLPPDPSCAVVVVRQMSAERLEGFIDAFSRFEILINEPLVSGSWVEVEAVIKPGKLYRITVEEIDDATATAASPDRFSDARPHG